MNIIILIYNVSISNTKYYNVNIPPNTKKQINNIKHFFFSEQGQCSYYHDKFNKRLTSNGDIFNNNKFTCAHKFLPLPCVILVIFNKNNTKYGIKLLINDRGPFVKDRIIDVSKSVAGKLQFIKKGIINVKIIFLPIDTFMLIKTGIYFIDTNILNINEINMILIKNNIHTLE